MLGLNLEGTMRLLWNIKSEREDVYNMDAAILLLAGDRIVLEEEEVEVEVVEVEVEEGGSGSVESKRASGSSSSRRRIVLPPNNRGRVSGSSGSELSAVLEALDGESSSSVLTFQPPTEPPPPTGVTAMRGLFE